MGKNWEDEAFTVGGEALVEKIKEMAQAQKAMFEKLDHFDKRHEKHEAAIEKLFRAFPEGDTEGHRRYHEIMIEKVEETRRLRVAVQEKTISGLIWAALVFSGLALWHYLLSIIKMGGGN